MSALAAVSLETPRANCAACACRVSLALNPPHEPDLKQGYRCTDCEQPFCAVCIKGPEHTSKWKAPCRDDEIEAWAAVLAEAPRIRSALATVTAERDEAVRLLHMLDRMESRHPDVATFLDGLAARGQKP